MIQLFPGNKSKWKTHCHGDSKKLILRVFRGLGFGLFGFYLEEHITDKVHLVVPEISI